MVNRKPPSVLQPRQIALWPETTGSGIGSGTGRGAAIGWLNLKSGITDNHAGETGAIDAFLSDCLRAAVHGERLAYWPEHLSGAEAKVIARLAFHGIAPFLGTAVPFPEDWPAPVVLEVRKSAGLVSFWENSHREAIATLLESFERAGIAAVVTKGTALAYSVYPQPCLRRRGDSDIIILSADRRRARAALEACGFLRDPAPRVLQEDWHYRSPIGIDHAVDVHWSLNASAAISRLLDRGECFAGRIALPGLAPGAQGMGPVGNLLLICVNRHSHGTMGYHIGSDKLFETDRLIWALDIFLLTREFDEDQWSLVVEQARLTGTAPIVRAGLQFAARTLGASIPDRVMAELGAERSGSDVAGYFATTSGARRLWMDVRGASRLGDKAGLLIRVGIPSDAFLAERFPDARHWPKPLLHLRRWVEGAARLGQRQA